MRKGFSLFEMGMVLVIVGILMALVIKGKELTISARAKKETALLYSIQTAYAEHIASYGRPPENTGIINLSAVPINLTSALTRTVTAWTIQRCNINGQGGIIPNATAAGFYQTNANGIYVCAFNTIPEKFICQIEKNLDDSNSNTGMGRAMAQGRIRDYSVAGTNCQTLNDNVSYAWWIANY